MASTKVTFTLDAPTLTRLEQAAERMAIPKSQVVREAIHAFHGQTGRLSEAEKRRMLRAFDYWVPRIPRRDQGEVDRELKEIRDARHGGGRKSP